MHSMMGRQSGKVFVIDNDGTCQPVGIMAGTCTIASYADDYPIDFPYPLKKFEIDVELAEGSVNWLKKLVRGRRAWHWRGVNICKAYRLMRRIN